MSKKGYTLSEVLVALAVIGFISAMTIPTIVSLSSASRRPMFRSAYRMLEVGVSQLINDASLYAGTRHLGQSADTNGDGLENDESFCKNFSNLINTIDVNCGTDATKTYSFISSNGMVWYGFEAMEGIASQSDTITVTVDIDGEDKGQNIENVDQFKIDIAGTGKININPTSTQAIEYLTKGGIRN